MGRLAIAYGSSLVVFLLMDIGWITLVVSPLYKAQLGSMVLAKPALAPAILFYLLYLAGLVFFAMVPGLRSESWTTGLGMGAAYGFFTYMTFSLTNLSVLQGWTTTVAASDIFWGVLVSAVTAGISTLVALRLG